MNRVDLVGRLTRDPELRHTTSGRAVCQINLAINRNFTSQNGEREADFINVVIWDKQAENVSKYMAKGRLVSVEGRLQSRSYDDKDGKRVYVTEVMASNVQFLSTGSSNNSSNNGGSYSAPEANPFDLGTAPEPAPARPVQTVSVEKDPFESFGESVTISDNDLPF